MKKFKLIDASFSYTGTCELGSQNGYLALNRFPKHVEWVHEGFNNYQKTFKNLESTDETFYTESLIDLGLQDNTSAKKYGWLIEPRWYNPMTRQIKSNPQPYIEAYDSIFTHDKELLDLDPTFKFVFGQGSIIEEVGVFDKSKLVSCVVSDLQMTEGHKLRLEIAKQIADSGEVDMYGKAFNYIPRKIDALKDYRFSFAMENDCYESYFTEKLHDCLLTGTMPIYLGAPNIGDFYNLDGIVIMDKNANGEVTFNSEILSDEYYNDHIDAVKDNYERVLQTQTAEDFMFLNYFNE
jgi:hypothetical protein|tara:strand:- start:40 stop:921 length:882 start_codon:yes stop_codon:yes gene_type:complete